MTLSSSEAELVALLEAAKVVLFMIQLFLSMKLSVKFPVIVRVDNVGVIFMATSQTKTYGYKLQVCE